MRHLLPAAGEPDGAPLDARRQHRWCRKPSKAPGSTPGAFRPGPAFADLLAGARTVDAGSPRRKHRRLQRRHKCNRTRSPRPCQLRNWCAARAAHRVGAGPQTLPAARQRGAADGLLRRAVPARDLTLRTAGLPRVDGRRARGFWFSSGCLGGSWCASWSWRPTVSCLPMGTAAQSHPARDPASGRRALSGAPQPR